MSAREPSALVTGATGFVGSHLTPALAAAGWRVSVLVRPSTDRALLPEGVTVFVDDGTAAGLDAVMAEGDPDVVFHLATHFLSGHTPEDVPALIEGNVLLGTRVAEALAHRGDRLFVNTASAWQHYDGADYRPVALYAATKQAQEDILRYYTEMERLRVVTLILFDTYGPADRRRKLLPLLAESSANGSVMQMSGGEQLIDLLHVDDVVAAFLRAAELGDAAERYQSYVVSSGSPVSLRDAVAAFEEATGRTVPVEWGVRPYRDREMFEPWDAGARLPGWKPEVELVDGLRRTFA
ncbi:MAG TPA: NAD(P)-dependent oxidoreductase [Acidimicrobiales bacterium]|nr:NAD(P)-dependent oxidoreductase [Acidimicrobiales bacterium]